jgi:hypothetical protein
MWGQRRTMPDQTSSALKVSPLPRMAVAALLFSSIVTVVLLRTDLRLATTLEQMRDEASAISALGALSGYKAVGGTEWTSKVMVDGIPQLTVLIPLSEAKESQSAVFWSEIAERVTAANDNVEFVGSCSAPTCATPPGTGLPPLTILSAMDPVNMRSLEESRRDGKALVYRAGKLLSVLPTDRSRESIVREIQSLALKQSN